MVIAGEASGDLHGGYVVEELKKKYPELELFGTGGKRLEAAGVELYYRAEELAVIGLWEVLKHYKFFKSVFNHLLEVLDEKKPDAVLLVDYPGFNLRFAEEVKKRGIKVIYYVAPQVWAWKKNRIEKIKAFVDELIVLFPFEVDYFEKESMKTHCFGHPLLDAVQTTQSKIDTITRWGLDPKKRLVSLLPGSRRNEILKHFPLLVEAANRLSKERDDVQFTLPLAPTVKKEEIAHYLENSQAVIQIVENDTYNVVGSSDFAVVASGTATLETAVLGTPMIIYYEVSPVTYFLGRYILKIGMIGLPNIVAGREVVPELIQKDSHPEMIAEKLQHYLSDSDAYQQVCNDLAEVKQKLGDSGAYEKTAEFIMQNMGWTQK